MERRLAALEAVIRSAAPEPEMDRSYEDLTADEQIAMYLLLDKLEAHHRFLDPGPPLTPKEETRMYALLGRGVLVPPGTHIDPPRR